MTSISRSWLYNKLEHLINKNSLPLVVAIDGRSGAGKTTIAQELAERLDATIISGDDFFSGGVKVRTDSPEILAENCIDWRTVRTVIKNLVDSGQARYQVFDWEKFDGSCKEKKTVLSNNKALILEGVYSARPELRDIIDVTILVRLSETERMNRLVAREKVISRWEKQWHRAEDWYFSTLVSESDFDYLVSND